MVKDNAWLSISQAAHFLGVHFTTLRRWSDQGLIEYVRTPGGKRKYHQKALAAFLNQYREPVKESSAFLVLQDQAISRTRETLQSTGIYQKAWYGQLSETQRVKMRSTGNRLVALMFHYTAHTENQERFLEEARSITCEYGKLCRQMGIGLSDCVQMFLLFRQPILHAIHETGRLPGTTDEEGLLLFEKMNHFLDNLLVAMVDAYQQL